MKIYVTEITDNRTVYDYEGERFTKDKSMCVFHSVEKLGKEIISWVHRDIIDAFYDEWNYADYDTYLCDPEYEEGCHLYEQLAPYKGTDGRVHQMPAGKLAHAYSFDMIELPDLDIRDWDSDDPKKAQELLPEMKEWVRNFCTHIKENLPSGNYKYIHSAYRDNTRTLSLRVVDLDKEFFNAPRVIIDETTDDRELREYMEHYNSKEGKAERKRREEAEYDLMWQRLEMGWHP